MFLLYWVCDKDLNLICKLKRLRVICLNNDIFIILIF